MLADVLPASVDFVSATSSGGTYAQTNEIVTCQLGLMTNGATATASIIVHVKARGVLVNMARALGGAEDATNSVSVQTNTAVFGPVIPVVTEIGLRSDQLVYDWGSNRLYAAVSTWNGDFENGVRVIDMSSGLIGTLIPLGTAPRQITVASNSQYLYAGVQLLNLATTDRHATHVYRVNLQTRTVDQQFPVVDQFNQQHTIVDMRVLPAQPAAVAIARAGPQNDVAIYQNGAQSKRSPVDLFCSHTGITKRQHPDFPTGGVRSGLRSIR